MTVRRIDPADPRVSDLVQHAGLPLDGLATAWAAFTVEDDSGVVGVAGLERHSQPPGEVFLLRSVTVRADRRGEGVGGQLVRAALEAADDDQDGCARVALLTETADDFFTRFGFQPVARDQLPPGLSASLELAGACPDTARAYLRVG